VFQIAPQKPLRAVRRLIKVTGSISSRRGGPQQATPREESRPPSGRGDCRQTASSQLVFGSACGPPRRAIGSSHLRYSWKHRFHGAGANPKPMGSGFATQRAKGIRRDHVPLLCGLFVRSPWLPQFGQQLPAPGRCLPRASLTSRSSFTPFSWTSSCWRNRKEEPVKNPSMQ